MTKKKTRPEGQTMINKSVNIKLTIEECKPHYNPRIISGAPEEVAIPASLVALLLLIVLSNDRS